MIKKIFLTRALLITLAVFLMVSLCFARGEKEVTPVKEKVLRVVSGFSPEGLDPAAVDCGSTLHGVGAIEYLVRISTEGKIEPELAKSFLNGLAFCFNISFLFIL